MTQKDCSVTTQTDYSVYRDVVNQLMSGNEQLPSLPSITFDIRRALEQPDISFLSLSKLIAKDPSLSALLLKCASSPQFNSHLPPQHLLDVVRILGMIQVERITMAHSIKSLFTIHSSHHKRLFIDAWNRIALKASVCTYIAQRLGAVTPDHALLGSILSEVGTLAVLSAFKKQPTPQPNIYIALCREYSKSLGTIMLKKWQVSEEYIHALRQTGDWSAKSSGSLNLSDIINLGLYHSLKIRKLGKDLPAIDTLAAYNKLPSLQNRLTPSGELKLVMDHIAEIRGLSRSLFSL